MAAAAWPALPPSPPARPGDAGHFVVAGVRAIDEAAAVPPPPTRARIRLAPAAAECRRLRSALATLLPDIEVLSAQVAVAARAASSPADAARLDRLRAGTLRPLLASLRRPLTSDADDAGLLRRAARVLPGYLRERRDELRRPAPFDAGGRAAAAAA